MGDRAGSFQRISEKIVRGITFLEEELFVEPPHAIEFCPFDDEAAEVFRKRIDQFGKEYARAPGIVVVKADGEEDMSALYEIEFFEQYKTRASVRIAGPANI